MSEQHTPGLLRLECGDSGSVAFNEDGTAVFADCPHGGIGKIQGQKNIRRAAACWNALDGISTSQIEAAARSGSIAYALHKVISQRDELLAALKHIEGVALADEWCDLPEIAKHARAAIAKVEGCGV